MSMLKPDYFFDLSAFEHASIFDNCTFVWEVLDRLSNYLKTVTLGKIDTDIPAGVFLINPEFISIGKNTVIEPGAYIKGPCWIGPDCVVRHGAYIRGNLLTGSECVIGHDTEIKNSILLNKAQAAHFAYLGDSVLGGGVNLGAGTKCANLKLNHQQIEIRIEDQTHQTNRRKLGAIIGDRSQLGCNTVTNPGTLIGKDVCAHPCTNFGGFVPSGSVVYSPMKPIIKKRV